MFVLEAVFKNWRARTEDFILQRDARGGNCDLDMMIPLLTMFSGNAAAKFAKKLDFG